jgi:hypothetical protein
VQLLEDMIGNVRSIDDLYFFFDKTLTEVRVSMTTVQPSPSPNASPS